MFRNIPTITKNLLIVNFLTFVAAMVLQMRGINLNAIGGLDKVEFFIDLLPSFRSSADAPQTRMYGLSFIF